MSWDTRRKRKSDKYIMRKTDLSEKGFLKSLQRGMARGYTATQKGGKFGPDAFEKGVEKFFTDTGKDEPVKDKKDQEIAKLKKDLELSKKQQAAKDNKMDKKAKVREGLADLAGRAEADHEVQMARADLYKIAKYAIKLHDMLKGVSEATGLEGWQQAKITKAADYISSVYHNLDYEMKFGEGVVEGKSPHKKGTKKYKDHMAAMHAGMKEDAYKANLRARLEEKAVSKDQQRAAGAALAAKRGDAPKSKLKGASKEMMKMSTKELEKFAGTKHKGLPEKK